MYDSSINNGGLLKEEAQNMLEFCVDLDSQDDLIKDLNGKKIKAEDSLYFPKISPDWNKIHDSREQVAPGVDDPKDNGFPPFDTAWTLWQRATPGSSGQAVYALALRGTVVSSLPSIWEDAIVATVAAENGMEFSAHRYLGITFADMPHAEVHAGFAYGVFSALFDSKFGILPTLEQKVSAGALLIVTGHSQGAAMATLVHALLHFAMRDNKFGLTTGKYTLKSYGFAQPKPGNSQFSMNFAEIATNRGNAFVFNNTLDPVPQVPLTLQFLADADADMPKNHSGLSTFIRSANNVFNAMRHSIDKAFTGKLNKIKDMKDIFRAEELQTGSTGKTPLAVSQNYLAAGQVIPLRGYPDGQYYENQPVDDFIQHHATSYRKLLEEWAGGKQNENHQ